MVKRKHKVTSHNGKRWVGLTVLLLLGAGAVWLLVQHQSFQLMLPTVQKDTRVRPQAQDADQPPSSEIPLCQKMEVDRWPYWHDQVVVQCSVFAKAAEGQQLVVDSLVRQRQGEIQDSIRRIVGNVELEHLRDPQLTTVKYRTLRDVNAIVGNGQIDKILIPDWTIREP